MGCDIHLYGEVKIKGKWYTYNHPSTPRSYLLFQIMANVRGSLDVKVVSKAKGLPKNIALVTSLAAEEDGSDGHHHTWLSAEEIAEVEKEWMAYWTKNGDPENNWERDLDDKYFGYLEGNSWADFHLYPSGRPPWIEDVRFVFWFDN